MTITTRKKAGLRRGALALGGLTAAGLAVELVARATLPAPYVDRAPLVRVSPDPQVGYRLVARQRAFTYQARVETDEHGRRRMPSREGPRFVFLGGSETFGKGVEAEQTFAARVAETWTGSAVNLGTPDWTLDQSLAAWRTEGATLAPDRVVLTLYWDDLFAHPRTSMLGDPAVQAPASKTPERTSWGPRRWLRDLGLLERAAPIYTRSTAVVATRNALKGAWGRHRASPAWVWRDALVRGDTTPELDAAFARMARGLAAFAAEADATVVLLPIEDTPTETSWTRRARAAAEQAGLRTVDAGPALRALGAAAWIPYDGRPSPAGHAAIAQAILAAD